MYEKHVQKRLKFLFGFERSNSQEKMSQKKKDGKTSEGSVL